MGKLADIKTKPTEVSVDDYIAGLENEQKRADSLVLLKLMEKHSGEKARLWGSSIIGFGNKRYVSPATGREVDWFILGFAPRKANISLYLSISIKMHEDDLKKLGKHKTGVGCLYINKLSDIDLKVLENMIKSAAKSK